MSTARDSASQGRTMAVIVWVAGTLLFGWGWNSFGSSAGLAHALAFTGAIMLPAAYVAYLWERGNELAKQRARTICPKCELAGLANVGADCACGGSYVAASTVKWVDPPAS